MTYRNLLFLLLLALLLGPLTTHAATDCNAVTEIAKVECESLLELYHSTDGANWTNNDGWNVTNTLCSWFGITCENGGVIEINLGYPGNNLNGTIPNFSGLPNLQRLELNGNLLTGTIPNFSGLPNLQRLELEGNLLTGTIPDFSGLPNLRSLFLNNNQLTGRIPDFSGLSHLIGFGLINNQVCKNVDINYSAWTIEDVEVPNKDPFGFGVIDLWQLQLDTFPYCPKPRQAIIIAGGGAQSTNSLWDTTEAISNRIYEVFHKKGFEQSEIYYLSPKAWADFDGDGLNDYIVDAPNPERPLTVEDVRKALEWAKTPGKLDQPLYLFFIDHGGNDKFMLSKLNHMEVSEFKTILDDYQNATGNEIVLVIDACRSGNLLEQLVAPNRAIISSTGAGLAHFDRIEKLGFSRFLANGLMKGMDFFEAFESARDEQARMLKDISKRLVGVNSDKDITQIPQLNDGNDGQRLRKICLNGCIGVGDVTLAVEGLTTSTTLPASETMALKAKAVVAQGQVTRVWVVLRPPKLNLVMDSYGTPILAFPRLTLSPTEEQDIWETTWQDAVYNGDYDITFYAEDNEGNIASSDNSVIITVTGGVEPPEQANVQLILEKDSYRPGESIKVELIENLGWGYDLYAAVLLPDGTNFIALENTNEFAPVNEDKKWLGFRAQNSRMTLVDFALPTDLATGEYCLYGILSPEREEVFETLAQDLWVMERRCFEILP